MSYQIVYTELAENHLDSLRLNEPNHYKKALKLIRELEEHPRTGTGHPEQLRGNMSGNWSREISKQHRMVYQIFDTEVVVIVISAYGHYSDK